MKHAPKSRVIPYDFQAIAMGFPVMYDDRLIQSKGQIDLAAEQGFLLGLVAGIPVVVQADLPNGNALGVGRQFLNLLKIYLTILLQLFGMKAHRGIDKRKVLRQG